MKAYKAFVKKEIVEGIRTYKSFIILIVFLLFGIMNPLIAKLTPYIMENLVPEGLGVPVLEPTAFDSWAQFYKNITQMGLLVTIVVFGGILATELSRGTLINVLSKGLSRKTVILAKYTSMALTWTLCYGASFGVTWGYTVYLFPTDQVKNLVFSVFCLWLFGLFLLALLMLASTMSNTNYGNLIILGVVVVISMLLNMIGWVQKYNPISLAGKNMELVVSEIGPKDLFFAVATTMVLTVSALALSVALFRKKQL